MKLASRSTKAAGGCFKMVDRDYDYDWIGTGDEERIEHLTPLWQGWLAILVLVLVVLFFFWLSAMRGGMIHGIR